jgi:hypothetical protein
MIERPGFPTAYLPFSTKYIKAMYLKIHDIPGQGSILAACDAELLGRTLTSPMCDIEIDSSFYGDKKATEEEFLDSLADVSSANLIGKRVCDIAIKAGLITKESCIIIEGIPHAQIYGV